MMGGSYYDKSLWLSTLVQKRRFHVRDFIHARPNRRTDDQGSTDLQYYRWESLELLEGRNNTGILSEA